MLFNVIDLGKSKSSHEGMILVPTVINLRGKQVTVGYWRYPEGVKGPKGTRKPTIKVPREPVPEPKTSYEKKIYDEAVRIQETVEAAEDKLDQAKRELKKIKSPEAGSEHAVSLVRQVHELESLLSESKAIKTELKLNRIHLEEELSKKFPKFSREVGAGEHGVITHKPGYDIYVDPDSEQLILVYRYPKVIKHETHQEIAGLTKVPDLVARDITSKEVRDKDFKVLANTVSSMLDKRGWDFTVDSAGRQIRITGYAGGGVTKHIIDLNEAEEKWRLKKGLPGLVAKKVTIMMSGHPYQGVRWVNPNPKTEWRRIFIDKYNLGGFGSELGFSPDVTKKIDKAFDHLSKALVVDGKGELKITVGPEIEGVENAEYFTGKHIIQVYGKDNTESLAHEYGHWMFDANIPDFPSVFPKSWDKADVISWKSKVEKVAKTEPIFDLVSKVVDFYKKNLYEFKEFSDRWAATQPDPKEFGDSIRMYLFTPQEIFARAVNAYVEQDISRSFFTELEDDPAYWSIVNSWGAKYLKTGIVKSLVESFTRVSRGKFQKVKEFFRRGEERLEDRNIRTFIKQRDKLPDKFKPYVTPYTFDEIKKGKFKVFLVAHNTAGVLVKPDGEIANLFSLKKGNGKLAHKIAHENGGTWGYCFDGKLVKYYKELGSPEFHREPNWEKGKPDIVFTGYKKDVMKALDKLRNDKNIKAAKERYKELKARLEGTEIDYAKLEDDMLEMMGEPTE